MTDPSPAAEFLVDAPSEGWRLDRFLVARLPDRSRSQIQRLIRGGLVTVDGHDTKTGFALVPGMTVRVSPPATPPALPAAEALPLEILYDDADLVVVAKPAGMVVHPAVGHAGGTLVNALLHHVRGLSHAGGTDRPGIVHRLDKGTSGVMVVARHDRAHRALARQFHDRTVEKEYVALVWGHPAVGQIFDQPIGRDPRHRQRISSRARHARTATTVVTEVERLRELSVVRLTIQTGRTHQIRVHLSEAGFPVAGDRLYGGVRAHVPAALAGVAGLTRPFLHAARLAFAHPADGRPMVFDAPLPAELVSIVDALRRSTGRAVPPDHLQEPP
jgi:23S rRNA pseudouridine1911/1915/1917 synthase